MNLPVGIRVVMSSVGKEEYPERIDNPHNVIGVVIHDYDCEGETTDWRYGVLWDNGGTNDYRGMDITPVITGKSLEDYI